MQQQGSLAATDQKRLNDIESLSSNPWRKGKKIYQEKHLRQAAQRPLLVSVQLVASVIPQQQGSRAAHMSQQQKTAVVQSVCLNLAQRTRQVRGASLGHPSWLQRRRG